MESGRSFTSLSLIPNLKVVCATKQYMESFQTILWKFCTEIPPDGAIYVQPPEAWIAPESMLQNSTKILVCEQLLPHAHFSDDGAHVADLRKHLLVPDSQML